MVVAGISHKTASLDLRQRLALDSDSCLQLAHGLVDGGVACEAVALSTCNRTELFLYGPDASSAHQAVLSALADRAGCGSQELEPSLYFYSGDAALVHLFRVASSLDSMVVGEAQIVSQLKAAYECAHEGGCTGVVLNQLFRRALKVGKRVRTETAIGERPVSVSSVAVGLALNVFGTLEERTVLVVGAGDAAELTVAHLRSSGVGEILVASRRHESAEALAQRVGGRAVRFEGLEEHLAAADIVISSTSAPHIVITRERVERSLRQRPQRPIFFIDIAVPRDLDPEIRLVAGARLHDIDDLQRVVERNRGEREREARHAERIIEEELAITNDWLRSLEVVPTIAELRAAVERIRVSELERLRGGIGTLNEEQRDQVEMLTTSIVNKILHAPTVKMKELAGRDECYVFVDAVRMLFDLDRDGTEVPILDQDPAGADPGDP